MENIDIKYFDIEELGTWPIHTPTMQASEGEQKLAQHLIRERNPQLVKAAKEQFKARNNGKMYCEVCKFDFAETYGEIGIDFIEAHHKKPISRMSPGDITTIDDFIMVCSNCHSMLHISKTWLSHEELIMRLRKNT